MGNHKALAAVGLFGSASASAYVLFSNVGMSQYGLIPYIRGKVAEVQLNGNDKIKTWKGYFENGKVRTVSGVILNAICGGIVALTHPVKEIQRLGLGSALLGLSIIPYTLGFLTPTNNQLMTLNNRAKQGLPIDERRVDELIEDWVSLHNVRYVGYLGSWLLATAALALNGNVMVEVLNVVYPVPT